MKLTELEYELIVLLKTINDLKNTTGVEITKVKQIKYEEEYKHYLIAYIATNKTNEHDKTDGYHAFPKWQIEKSGIPYLLIKFVKENPITKWWNYHIYYKIFYKIFYKWECYRDNGYSWKQILLGIADKKENAWQVEQINKLEQRIEVK